MLSIWNVLTNILNGEIVNLYKNTKQNQVFRERDKKGTFFMNRSRGWWKNKIFLSCLSHCSWDFGGGVLERLYSWLVLVLFTPIFVAHVFDFLWQSVGILCLCLALYHSLVVSDVLTCFMVLHLDIIVVIFVIKIRRKLVLIFFFIGGFQPIFILNLSLTDKFWHLHLLYQIMQNAINLSVVSFIWKQVNHLQNAWNESSFLNLCHI